MLIGEQENVAIIDFVPGENAETLMSKYQDVISTKLSHCEEFLFLVDTWGGSPFNAANRLTEGKSNMDVVTGVNIPMLIESFMARDDGPNLSELVTIALESARAGIRALRNVEQSKPTQSVQVQQPQVAMAEGHMKIGLARIDDRLIHGQVATRWTKESKVNRIIVVNNDVAKDSVRTTMLKSVAPPGVSAHVVDLEKMVRVYNNPEYAKDRVMLLFTNPTDVLTLLKAGVEMKSINIGGIAYKEGKTMITSAIAVDDKDIAAFKAIDEMGIELDVRKVSNDPRQHMMDLLKKNNLV